MTTSLQRIVSFVSALRSSYLSFALRRLTSALSCALRPLTSVLSCALLSVLAGVLAPSDAEADIVKLTNGRTMTVESCAFEGTEVIFRLAGGGQIRAPRSIVDEILPDEIPFARTVAIEALAASPSANRFMPDEAA